MKKNYTILILFFAVSLALTGCTQLENATKSEIPVEETTMDKSDVDTSEDDSMMLDGDEQEESDSEDSALNTEVSPWELVDGVYETTVSYSIPNDGKESIEFMVSVDDEGVVTDVEYEAVGDPAPISVKQQASFGENIDELVVGKSISEIEPVDRVGTSSLTAGAFYQAIERLQSQIDT